jgi:Flp pilus assembly protein TadG
MKHNFIVNMMIQRLTSLIGKYARCERGATLVEMTLIVPLLISLSAGVFEFGHLIQNKLLLEAGVRDGARYGARCNTSLTGSPTGMNCISNVRNIAVTGTHDGSGSARVKNWVVGDVTVAIRNDEVAKDPVTNAVLYRSQTSHVQVIRVTTSYSYTGASLLSHLGFGPFTISASHEERFLGF